MKIVGIGDLFIPSKFIEKGFEGFGGGKLELTTVDWTQRNLDELQKINLLVEQGGSEAYEVEDDIIAAVKDADIIITQFCPINRKVIDACPNLKVIGVLRGGIENINLDYAKEKGILVYNTPGRNADAVADFTVGGILAECRNIARSHAVVKAGGWKSDYPNRHYIPDLPGKTVGLVGFGEIGRKVAQRLAGFEVNLLAYDPYFKGEAPFGVKMVDLDELMATSDFISLHARMMPETRHMINAENLAKVKPGAYFINTARSGLVDEKALYDALTDGRLVGAFLDVFEEEPTNADYPLVKLDNVTVTPHMAGGSKDAFWNSPIKLAKEMGGLLTGECGRAVMNKDQFEAVSKLFA
ncbi:MAG: 2-hydroxyacid dehydrogenase [Oscillospiraceae bacterium]|nr:2-hydroxyacid dehydrogenase [Oscillospiraceae bacterium]MBQ8918275.1 2-hydroxyacid dehydrogenase [Oscillospiraceae bacterium]MBQ9109691.1 2-hydroxyacid dehydrogenase [Oscillospiraceae bacterium]